MNIEVVCPRGHRIREESDGCLTLSPFEDERLDVELECWKCGLAWEMSLRLFTCDRRKLGGPDLTLKPSRK